MSPADQYLVHSVPHNKSMLHQTMWSKDITYYQPNIKSVSILNAFSAPWGVYHMFCAADRDLVHSIMEQLMINSNGQDTEVSISVMFSHSLHKNSLFLITNHPFKFSNPEIEKCLHAEFGCSFFIMFRCTN